MVRVQRDAKLSDSIIATADLLSDSRNWPDVPFDYLFLNQCQDKPDKQAVIGKDGSLTYQELDRLSLQWACWLRSKGIKQQDKVLVCMERTIELPAVLLGILRAGACYVPVDPAFPADRIAIIIEDSDAVIAVSDRKSHHLLPADNHFVCLVAEDRPPLPESYSLPSWNAEDLAYLIFTSGSTGRPKGVPITRAAMVNFLLAMAEQPGIEATDRVLALTTISFDISILELFLPLIAGATVHLVSRQDSLDPQALSRIINDNQLTLLQATPATWRFLYDYGWRPQRQQRLLCGGEAFPSGLARGLIANAGEVWNMYGPTEATVWSSCHRVTESDLKDENIPLGSPLPNIEYLVIDESNNACPQGCPGELLIAGVALTPGYYGRPELNEVSFVLREDNGKSVRYYRTGDLVCENSRGELIYVNRLDNQVKIRGFRVELGEIEASLSRIVQFGDSAVIAANPAKGETVLVGCIESGAAGDPRQIEAALSKKLPHYMIPRVWRWYSELPKTPNRKIDRKALRRLVEDEYANQHVSVGEFADPLMATIARHWKRLLGVGPTQETDDFLAMGGHSLMAAQLSVALSDETGRYIRPVELIVQSSLADHCRLLNTGTETTRGIDVGPYEYPGVTGIPFSSAQKRMWYIVLSGNSEGIFNESEAYRIEGKLDLAQLKQAIQKVIDKHVAFRMVVESEQDLTWKVLERVDAPLREVSFSDDKESFWNTLPTVLHEEATRSFRFFSEPLIRFVVYTDGVGRNVIQFVAHHLIIDGLSETLLWKELADFYQNGEGKAGKPLKQDTAYLTYLNSQPLKDRKGLQFWVDHLLSTPQVQPFDIRTDFPRPAKTDYSGKEAFLDLPIRTADLVRDLAKRLHSTPFMVFLTIYLVWLNRHSGQEEYVIGTPVSGREPQWPGDMAGLFMNTIPLRLKSQDAFQFPELLSVVSEIAREAMRHDHIQFDEIVQEVNPERDPSRTPIYQVIFSFNEYSHRPRELSPGLRWTPEPVNVGFSPVDLALFTDLYPDRLRLRFQASDRLFSYETIERFLRRYAVMLESVTKTQDLLCREIPLLDSTEQKQLLDWAGEAREYPRNATIDQCFQYQVATSPDAPAIETRHVSLSYRELSKYADSIARSLRESGLKTGDRVAVPAQQSLETVAGILGILRAGCVYIPMDFSHPLERLHHISDKASAKAVLVTKEQSGEKNGLGQFVLPIEIACWSEVSLQNVGECKEREETGRSAQSPAYVMFTSGSTGAPKGIEVTHQNVARLVINTNFMTLDSDTRFLMYAPVAFDASTLEIWGPLLNGGTLVIPDDQPSMDQLDTVLAERNVNCLWLTAALFHYMAEHAPSAFSGLKYLLAGGDVLSPKWVKRVLSNNPGLTLINGYGPTENTTFTCCHSMASPDEVPSPVPIGKPVANTWVYVLDQTGNDCPIGIPGELYVGGDGVALGYIGDQKLTERSFIANPFGKQIGRVYRTGDKVCWRSDGTLEFLGRFDNQMKIRGFRIEPDEVNEIIESYPGIEHSITVGWTPPSGDMQLISYVTPAFTCGDEVEKLRSWLGRKLPRYMLPARLIGLDALPVGLTGKVDRKRLPDPLLYPDLSTTVNRTPPATHTEKTLANIWKRTLGIENVYCEDDFFVLGGSSIKALEVFGYLAKDLRKDIPLSTLLEYPTLRELARELDRAQPQADNAETGSSGASQTNWNCLVKLGGSGNTHPIVCVHAVGGNVLSYRRILEVTEKGRSLLGFQSCALDGKTTPPDSLHLIAKDYAQELLASGYKGPYTLMGGSLGGTIALEMAHILTAEGAEVDWVILLDTIGPNGRDIDELGQEETSILNRIRKSVKARIAYYSRAGIVASCRALGFRIPYNLRPFFIQELHKKLLRKHIDRQYHGNVLLIRGRRGLGGVYYDPYLGWQGVLTGELKITEIDVSHDVFMESPETIEGLRAFF
ncbi:non-ribosomal peptide synthetase [Marinobacter sp. CHS3-4]|uniref:non-ribosomal peptide synthetase n=1 Tax=Marinobacter sp. CHS3-4 TaxID=3045174 RepID=UPI0024B4988D|nr:non-ribosomal peptide synthetase [Marinobacter sp. CHS3-4]MDI9245587.1 amino acid adenylation domain-containing protein [Marinobacter sp. CHS3-4]